MVKYSRMPSEETLPTSKAALPYVKVDENDLHPSMRRRKDYRTHSVSFETCTEGGKTYVNENVRNNSTGETTTNRYEKICVAGETTEFARKQEGDGGQVFLVAEARMSQTSDPITSVKFSVIQGAEAERYGEIEVPYDTIDAKAAPAVVRDAADSKSQNTFGRFTLGGVEYFLVVSKDASGKPEKLATFKTTYTKLKK